MSFSAYTQQRIDKANELDPEVTAQLPRLCLKEHRYGVTFVVLDCERMIVGRKVPHFQTGDYAARHPGAAFHPEVMIDCPHCRLQRLRLHDMFKAEGCSPARIVEKLAEWKKNEDYWCNQCQATGWDHEPREACIARLGAVTWEDKVQDLSNTDVVAQLRRTPLQMNFPEAVLRLEAARRLEALS